MNCVKCGRETEEDQVFCGVCMDAAEKYPVNPTTVVHIPVRKPEEEIRRRAVKKKLPPTLSEQNEKLRKKLKRLRITVAVLLLACALLFYGFGRATLELDFQRLLGQNYNTTETTP